MEAASYYSSLSPWGQLQSFLLSFPHRHSGRWSAFPHVRLAGSRLASWAGHRASGWGSWAGGCRLWVRVLTAFTCGQDIVCMLSRSEATISTSHANEIFTYRWACLFSYLWSSHHCRHILSKIWHTKYHTQDICWLLFDSNISPVRGIHDVKLNIYQFKV